MTNIDIDKWCSHCILHVCVWAHAHVGKSVGWGMPLFLARALTCSSFILLSCHSSWGSVNGHRGVSSLTVLSFNPSIQLLEVKTSKSKGSSTLSLSPDCRLRFLFPSSQCLDRLQANKVPWGSLPTYASKFGQFLVCLKYTSSGQSPPALIM